MVRFPLISVFALLPAFLLGRSPELLVWTEMTDAGRQLPVPSPDEPVYYQAINVGYQTFARVLAGDREPPADEFLQTVLQQLVRQGYRPSTAEHPPSMVLGFSWGDLRGDFARALFFLGGEQFGLLGFVDPLRYGAPPLIVSGDRDRLLSLASVDLYVVTIAAYDHAEAVRGRIVKLWQTRIACPARGFYAEAAIPRILVAAAPLIGRETERPMWMTPAEVARRATVEIGELTSVGPMDADDAILLDIPREQAAAEARGE